MGESEPDRRVLLAAAAAAVVGALSGVKAEAQSSLPSPENDVPKKREASPLTFKTVDDAPKRVAPGEAVEFGREPEERRLWSTVRELLRSDYALSEDGKITGHLAPSALRIEAGLKFASEEQDDDFVFLHVEPLLDQAADLLDRCLRDRSTWDDLAQKNFSQWLELAEYAALDEIHQREEAAGLYDVEATQSRAEASSELILANLESFQRLNVERILSSKFSSAEMNEANGWNQLAAWLQGLVGWWIDGQKFAGYTSHTWNGVSRTVAKHALEAAFKTGWRQLELESFTYSLQSARMWGNEQALRQKVLGLQAKGDWDAQNRRFRRERTEASRRLEDVKAKAATAEDGALNYAKRLPAIKSRFQSDYRDAYARLVPAAKGLKVLYGYEEPLPVPDGSIDHYDACLSWCRRAIQWLVRFSRREQTLVLPVSLAERTGALPLNSGRPFSFTLEESVFDGMSHVRLRGMAAFARQRCGTKQRVWQILVTPPKVTSVRHRDGSLVKFDQSELPPCRVGRVQSRQAERDPDVVGVSALHNASPIGTWEVKVLGCVPGSNHLPRLEDIELDLILSYRAV